MNYPTIAERSFYASPFLKSPEHLVKLVAGIEIGEVLKTKNFSLDINYLEKPIEVWAERKDGSGIDKLELNHTGEIHWNGALQNFLFDNTFSFQRPQESLQQGKETYGAKIHLNKEPVFVGIEDMDSTEGYKLGRLLHGVSSIAYREIAQLFNQIVPYAFCVLNESTPFHLKCTAIVTKFKNHKDIISALHAKPNTTIKSLRHPDFTPDVTTAITERFKKRSDFDECDFLDLLPVSVLDLNQEDIDYCLLLPNAARRQLEKEFKEALKPPTT